MVRVTERDAVGDGMQDQMLEEITTIDDEARWQAVVARDPAQDGVFVYAVTTTGVYCRPSCPSRRPNRGNVIFFTLNRDAESAGFRPCRRCRPNEPSLAQELGQAVERACRRIERAEREPSLAELATEAGLSPHHFHRVFKRIAGMTPKAYAKAHREARLRAALGDADSTSVTDAILAAGYTTPGRAYEGSTARLGMDPRTYRAGAAGVAIHYVVRETWLGLVLVAVTERGVCCVRFGQDREGLEAELRETFPRAELHPAAEDLAGLIGRVLARIENPAAAEELPLDIQGTLFQERVWAALRAVPAGETSTYAQIAAAIGAPKAVRAVAQACGANPVAVAIPCHRIVRSDGSLSGYRWGPERKRRLLAREAGG